jgi:hypothetical protein
MGFEYLERFFSEIYWKLKHNHGKLMSARRGPAGYQRANGENYGGVFFKVCNLMTINPNCSPTAQPGSSELEKEK